MIPLLLIAGVAAAGYFVVKFWKEIVEWAGKAWDRLPEQLKQDLQGVKAFIDKANNIVKTIAKYYSYNKTTQKWTESCTTREIDPNDVPEEFRTQMEMSSATVDISNSLKEKLQLANA